MGILVDRARRPGRISSNPRKLGNSVRVLGTHYRESFEFAGQQRKGIIMRQLLTLVVVVVTVLFIAGCVS